MNVPEGIIVLVLGGGFAIFLIGMLTYWISDNVVYRWKYSGYITPIVVSILIIGLLVTCVAFGVQSETTQFEAPATVIKIESQSHDSTTRYVVWANDDNTGYTYEMGVESTWYANTKVGDKIIVYYAVTNNWFGQRVDVKSVTRLPNN